MPYTNPTEEEVAERRAQLAPFDTQNERIYLALYATLLAWQGIPRTYLDLGSGTGAMVNLARKLDIDAYGVDVINGPEHWFIKHDLATPLRLTSLEVTSTQLMSLDPIELRAAQFDLITCLEVAEHLPEEAADALCDTIERHMAPRGLLVFSAAVPGQEGENHVNLQPASYWRTKLYDRGISYRADYTAALAHLWAWTAGPLSWLASNVQVFDR